MTPWQRKATVGALILTLVGGGIGIIVANGAGTTTATTSSPSDRTTTSGGGGPPSSGTALCGQPILDSPFNYDGAAGPYSSGTAGLPTFGSSGTNFPTDTAGDVIATGTTTSSVTWNTPNTVYYFEPGAHDQENIAYTGVNDAYVGGYTSGAGKAVLNGVDGATGGTGLGGSYLSLSSSGTLNADQTWEYLTVENYTSSENDSSVLGNESGATYDAGNTYEYDTVGPNEYGYVGSSSAPAAGQDSGGGYAIAGQSNTVIEDDCLTHDAQGAFNLAGGANPTSGTGTPATILTGEVVSNNEITQNGLGTYPDAFSNPNRCGCSGGGKFFWTLNTVFSGNYVHDNYNQGVWFDFDNAGADISDNYVSSNWAWGIYYEASYNADISDNTVVSNGWASDGSWPASSYCPSSCTNGNGPFGGYYGNVTAGGILVVDSGGNANVAGSNYSGSLRVEDNVVSNDWTTLDIYQDDSRFSGGPSQCNGPLLDQSSTYYQQWDQQDASNVVTNGTATITSAGGFRTFFQNGTSGQTNYCGNPGPVTTPSAGEYAYDSKGEIPAGDTVASCSSANDCTLSTPATGSTTGDTVYLSAPGGCGYADLIGSKEGATSGRPAAHYWDNCLYATRNVAVSGNHFNMASDRVTGCTAANLCGVIGVNDAGTGFPAAQFDIYNGSSTYFTTNAPLSTSPLGVVFTDNTYTWTGTGGSSTWQFEAGNQGTGADVTHARWTGSPCYQDAGSSGL
ncbi:MAG: right-handed parallel beta-helix repeat-containing protein [Acidimicrobiales bacterium]